MFSPKIFKFYICAIASICYIFASSNGATASTIYANQIYNISSKFDKGRPENFGLTVNPIVEIEGKIDFDYDGNLFYNDVNIELRLNLGYGVAGLKDGILKERLGLSDANPKVLLSTVNSASAHPNIPQTTLKLTKRILLDNVHFDLIFNLGLGIDVNDSRNSDLPLLWGGSSVRINCINSFSSCINELGGAAGNLTRNSAQTDRSEYWVLHSSNVLAPVPVPPALLLYLSGFGLIGAFAWRRS